MQPCEDCPWGGGGGCVSSPERRKGALVGVLGEGPAEEECAARPPQCFVGPSGVELEKTMRRAGIARAETTIENAFGCWKPKGATAGEEGRAVEACRGRVEAWLQETQPRSLYLLGASALRSIAPGFMPGGVMRHRGSLWSGREVRAANRAAGRVVEIPESVEWVMASIHPAAIIRRERLAGFAAMGYRGVPAVDLRRLLVAGIRGRVLAPVEMRYGIPTFHVEHFVFDLETRMDGTIEWVGVQKMEGGPVWGAEWGMMEGWMREEMGREGTLKVGHNITGFDLHRLMDVGVEVAEPLGDTQVLGGMCEPDMARGLYYQMAYYGGHVRPYWKQLAGRGDKEAEVVRRRALWAAWVETGMAQEGWMDGQREQFYNALDVDSTRLVWEAQMGRAVGEGWA